MVNWETILTSAIFPAIVAVWIWWSTKYQPAQLKRKNVLDEANRQSEIDTREHKQKEESESLSQVIKINETFSNAFIDIIDRHLIDIQMNFQKNNSELSDVRTEVMQLSGEIKRLKGHVQLHSQESARLAEVHTDIDLELHEIKGMLKGTYNES